MATVTETTFSSNLFPWLTNPETVYELLSDLLPEYEADLDRWAHKPGIVAETKEKIAQIQKELVTCSDAILAADAAYGEWADRIDAEAAQAEEEELWAAARDYHAQAHTAPAAFWKAA